MATLRTCAKYLSERGITVTASSDMSLCCGMHGDINLCVRESTNRGFVVENNEKRVPGVGKEDFSVSCETLDECVLIVWGFFFAKPIQIDEWLIPIHRHPYWSLAKVQYLLSSAPHVSEQQFQAIEEERTERLLRDPRVVRGGSMDFAQKTQFFACPHRLDKGATLMLRRDLDEGYFVRSND